jgi:hypothetical protein
VHFRSFSLQVDLHSGGTKFESRDSLEYDRHCSIPDSYLLTIHDRLSISFLNFLRHKKWNDVVLWQLGSKRIRGNMKMYEAVSKSFRTESITKYTLTTINTCWEATQRVMAAKLTGLTHRIVIQLHLVAESCIICGSRSRRPVRKLFDTHSCLVKCCHQAVGTV